MILHSNIMGSGRPLIILHGFLGMADNWKTLGQKFAASGYEVHMIDQRNHGRSFHSEVFDYESMASDLLVYLKHKNLTEVILLGHSMGGKTAMLFATLHAKVVSKLIVADISPRFYPIHHETILNGLSSLDFSKIKSRGEADEVLSEVIHDFGIRQFLLKNLYWVEKGTLGFRMNLKVLKEQVSEVGEALPAQNRYEGDTLFLRGDRSEYIQSGDEVLIKRHFPNSQIKTIQKAGHWLHAENPTAFYNEVINFIR